MDTHTHVGFYGLRGLSIGVMVFILYKLYVLLPYTYPTPKLSPHRRRCISTFPQKTHSVWFISILNYGDTENVLINHLLLVIPMSYPCHVIIHICVLKPYARTRARTHTHARTHAQFVSVDCGDFPQTSITFTLTKLYFLSPKPKPTLYRKPVCILTLSDKHHWLFYPLVGTHNVKNVRFYYPCGDIR